MFMIIWGIVIAWGFVHLEDSLLGFMIACSVAPYVSRIIETKTVD
jgi:uncharacterized membrane protein YccC